MKKARLKTTTDYLALLVRARWWVIATVIALGGLSVLVARTYPRMYVSRTMIVIQEREVPDEFVKDLIGGETQERLFAIQQTILSRTNLLKILREFEASLPSYARLNDEQKVNRLQKRISIDFLSERVRGRSVPVTNIQIAYRDPNPELAQRIAARLASLFIEQDSRNRESKVFGTAEFLESELKKVAEQLRQSEDTMRQLKQRNQYTLPSQQESNLRTLDRLQAEKTANLEALDRYVTLQLNLEQQISETPAMLPNPNARSAAPVNPLAQIYREKELEYKALTAKAKPTHPDVRRLEAELDKLRAEIPPEDLARADADSISTETAPAMIPNPVYQKLTAQLRQLKTDIALREQEKVRNEREIETYNRRIQSMPFVEQEMLAITRTNADLTKQHDDLKAKLEQARLAGSLESRQKGAQFEIVDPANYPLEPAPPSRMVILLIGFVLSLGGGAAAALAVNALSPRIWTHQEVERALETAVLAEIPSIVTPADLRKARIRRLSAVAAFVAAAGLYVGGLYYLYISQSPVLRLLNPIIEKIEARSAASNL